MGAGTRISVKSLKFVTHKISKKSALTQASDEINKKSNSVPDSRQSWFKKLNKEAVKG
jgi:hypothetical protein